MVVERGFAQVARELGFPPSTLRSHLLRQGLPTAKGEPKTAGERSFTIDNLPDGANWTPEVLLKQVGLNPDEWRITNVRARGGHWGNPTTPSSQVRLEVSVVPVTPPFKFPDPDEWKPLPKPKPRKETKVHTAVVIGDHHAPHHDRTFHTLFCQYLTDEQPDLIEVNGDLLDFADISRHRPREGYDDGMNETLQAGYDILRDYREACPDTQIRYSQGNHEARLEHMLIDNVRQLHKVQAPEDDVPALSLRRLLHLDHLQVEYVEGDWDRVKKRIGKRVTTLHGYSTSKQPGAKMLTDLSGSTLQGHSHRLSLTYRTTHHHDEVETRLAGECGCACEVSDGLGYSNAAVADWQNGFMIVKTHPDDDFTVAPAIYLSGRLLLPDGRRYD
jgi:hypothetical protein